MIDHNPLADRPLRVKLTTNFPHWPIVKQTPGSRGIWRGIEFFINTPVEDCDAWFVYEGLVSEESTHCPADNVIFITAEPPAFKRYNSAWLRSFPRVISSQSDIRHSGLFVSQTGLPWLVEPGYDQLKESPLPIKTRNLSAISSNKQTTRGHRQRFEFIQAIQGLIPDIEVFGRGIRTLEKKWDGLASYRFSVAIENSSYPDYWTEKIADCFLAGTVPFYAGCPNIARFFHPDSFVLLPLENPLTAVEIIRNTATREEYERRLPAIHEARRRVLEDYNVFNVLANYCQKLKFPGPHTKVRVLPEPRPSYLARKMLKWRRRWLEF